MPEYMLITDTSKKTVALFRDGRPVENPTQAELDAAAYPAQALSGQIGGLPASNPAGYVYEKATAAEAKPIPQETAKPAPMAGPPKKVQTTSASVQATRLTIDLDVAGQVAAVYIDDRPVEDVDAIIITRQTAKEGLTAAYRSRGETNHTFIRPAAARTNGASPTMTGQAHPSGAAEAIAKLFDGRGPKRWEGGR